MSSVNTGVSVSTGRIDGGRLKEGRVERARVGGQRERREGRDKVAGHEEGETDERLLRTL